MLNQTILWSLRNRLVVLALAAILIALGLRAAADSPLDVFPDFAPPQVTIQTEAPGFSPEEVEQAVTVPLETALNGTSNLETIRSSSISGLSVIVCVFQSGTEIFHARQMVTERLQLARSRLPLRADEPQMMPISSVVGTVLEISLTSTRTSMMDLRTLADWTIKPRLLAAPGVSQVTIYGGEVEQYQVLADPAKLKDYGVTLDQVAAAARQSSVNAGAGFLETGSQSLPIQALGRVHSTSDLGSAVVAVKNNVPVAISQVASVRLGPAYKVGDSSTFGKPSVLILVHKQPWANTLKTTSAVKQALTELRAALPPDVSVDPEIFSQADFINRAVTNIDHAMVEGGLLVVLVLFLFLFSWRTGLISLLAIPLSLLVAVIVLRLMGGTLNTMTLGGLAIAIGEVVDDAIVDVENIHRRLGENRLLKQPEPALSVIFRASSEVRGSVVYASLIVALVFLPIFALSGLAGKIFAPLAVAYIVSILASLVVALTITPALSYFLLPPAAAGSSETVTVRLLKRGYKRLLDPVLNHPRLVIASSVTLLIGAIVGASFFEGEFLPEFNEGNLIVHLTALPGTSLEESMRVGALLQQRLTEVPEVIKVAQRAGRAELGEDTTGPEYNEFDVRLRESSRSRDAVINDVRSRLADFKGFAWSINQFISERIEEVLSGTTATIVVKLFGPDLGVLREKAAQIQAAMATAPGVVDLNIEQQTGEPKIAVSFDRQAMAQYGLNSGDLAQTVRTAFFGSEVSSILDQQKTFAIVVRDDPDRATGLESIRETLVDTPTGAKIPLSAVAGVAVASGPSVINREDAQRRILISCDVEGASLSGAAESIKRSISKSVQLPAGYYVTYGGQYEARQAAVRDMLLLGAAAVVGIFLMLFVAFRSIRQSLLVMANLPLALVGGVASVLLASGGNTSVASLIGFVTLFGIATRNGIMLITHYHHLMIEDGVPFGRDLVVRGATERLSPILMTALTAGLALLPLAVSAGKPGRELEQPMSVVILGGLVTSTLLNMVVLPALYLRFGRPAGRESATVMLKSPPAN